MITPHTYPLPYVGVCSQCGQEVRIRVGGESLHSHERLDGTIVCLPGGYGDTRCPGRHLPPVTVLEPTFARWLWSHRSRRDSRTNRVTMLTQVVIGLRHGCGIRRFEQVRWATAGELHHCLHDGPRALVPRVACERLCQDVWQAAAIYDGLIEESKT